MKNRSLFLFSLFLLFAALTFSTPAWADALPDYMKVTAVDGDMNMYVTKTGTLTSGIQYSTDGSSWTDVPTASASAYTIPQNSFVYLRGLEDNKTVGLSKKNNYWTFKFTQNNGSTGTVELSGNIMSLVDPAVVDTSTIPVNYCFYSLFKDAAYISSAQQLRIPATTLTDYCYYYMFSGCTSLIHSVRILPALTVPTYACCSMFYNCTSLVDAPQIKGNIIKSGSFKGMFQSCSQLVTAPDTLYSPVVPEYAYNMMFYGCTSLSKSPVILAKTPRSSKQNSSQTKCSCAQMFENCSALAEITSYFGEWSSGSSVSSNSETYLWASNNKVQKNGVYNVPISSYLSLTITRGNGHYIPRDANNKWEVRAFFDYRYDTKGGTWAGGLVGDSVRRSYIDLPYNVTTASSFDTVVATSPVTAQKTDSIFYGWNLDKNATISTETGWLETDKRSDNFIYADTTYYAIYRVAVASKLTFDKNGYGTWTDPEHTGETVVLTSPASAAPGITRAGYEVKEWNTSSTGVDGEVFVPNKSYMSDKTFYAIWEPQYTFDVKTNGGKWSDGTDGDSVRIASTISTLLPAVKTDYVFVRWNTLASGLGTDLNLGNLPSVPTTYYAIFTPNYHFLKGEGTWENGKATTDSILNAPIASAPIITRAHHDFLRWNTQEDGEGQDFNAGSLPATPTTYHAIWYAHPKYTFDVNGGNWGTATGTNDSIFYSFTANPVATRNGYAFLRWNTEQDGSGTNFDWEHPVGVSTKYYAIWSENSYTFRVTTNGGTWKDDCSTQDRVMTTTQIMDMSASQPVARHESYVFVGWNTNSHSAASNFDKNHLPATSTIFHAIFLEYLYFQAETDNVKVGIWSGAGGTLYPDFRYSTDGIHFTKVNNSGSATRQVFITLEHQGDRVYLKGNNPGGINTNGDFNTSKFDKFFVRGAASVGGNIMYLIDTIAPPETIPGENCFRKLFHSDTERGASVEQCDIVSIANLKLGATKLKKACYQEMFYNCNMLEDAMNISFIDSVPNSAFESMFYSCDALLSMAQMPQATHVGKQGYKAMYQACTSLTNVSPLVATSIEKAAYYSMFQGCTSLVNAPTIYVTSWETSTSAGDGAMAYMFKGCTALRSMDVKFTAWDDRALSTSAYTTYQWMDGTTTDIMAGAIFSGPASLASVPQDVSHIQVNWNLILPELIVSEDKTSSELGGYAAKLTITNGATLTLDADYMAKNITVGAGCKLTIPDTRTLVADSIFLQGGDANGGSYVYSYPEMVVNGNIHTTASTATPIFYDYLLNKAQNYTLALPYNVECKEVRYAANGELAPFVVRKYDGARRAEKGADGKNWTNLWYKQDPTTAASTTLEAGRGYTVYCSPRKVNGSFETYSRLRFPMHPDFTSNAEQGGKTVQVYGYGCSGGEPTTKGNEAHVGWNLVGNPYLAKFGESWIALRVSEDEIVDYAIIPNDAGTHYTTTVMVDAKLPAFKNFFIQMFDDATITYDIHTRIQEISARRAAANEANKKVFVGIALKGAGLEDKMGLAIRNDYTEAYDPYADLTKWQNSDINLSAEVGGNSLSMAAVNMTMAENRIPLTVSVAKATELTFSIHEAWGMNTDELKHLYLLDETTGETIDLLTEDYTYQAKAGETKGRFFLMAEPRHIATDIDALSDDDESDIEKFILNGQLYIRRDGVIYNAQGTRVK